MLGMRHGEADNEDRLRTSDGRQSQNRHPERMRVGEGRNDLNRTGVSKRAGPAKFIFSVTSKPNLPGERARGGNLTNGNTDPPSAAPAFTTPIARPGLRGSQVRAVCEEERKKMLWPSPRGRAHRSTA